VCMWPSSAALLLLSVPACSTLRLLPTRTTRCGAPALCAADPPASGPSPEEWRKFRQQLISGGLKLTTEATPDGEGAAPDDATPSSAAAASSAPRLVVAPGNEALLKEQSEELWREYTEGSWAHESPVEAGGMLLRMPLEAQLTQSLRSSGGGGGGVLGSALRSRFEAELPVPEEGDSGDAAAKGGSAGDGGEEARFLANTAYCYRLCEGFVAETLQALLAKAKGGKATVDAASAGGVLLQAYQEAGQEWQQVVLVLRSSAAGADGVALNRPLAARGNRQLAELLLRQTGAAEALVGPLLAAFGDDLCAYLGGPSEQESGGLLVHGDGSLEGAVEVSPGTRIFTGGERAAIEAVAAGRASPLAFRWFLGRHTGLTTGEGAWRAVACARPVALKQCLGLPKPLWHEVMELCGGECATLSRLEILKRDDLPSEDD